MLKFFNIIKVAKKNSGVVVVQDRIRNFTWPSSPYSQISMANPGISIFSKKVIRTNNENSVEAGFFVPSLIHSFSYVY